MTEQKIKKILGIKEWSEINNPEQFLKLMNYFYDLAPGVKERAISKIPDINGIVESFKQYCAFGIIEYEPSIIMVVSKLVDDIKAAVGSTNKIRGPEKREKISYLYSAFSEWFGLYSEVQCRLGEKDFVCNVAEAIEIARENEDSQEEGNLTMMLITKERAELLERQQNSALSDLEIDLDFLNDLLGEEQGITIYNKKTKKYLM